MSALRGAPSVGTAGSAGFSDVDGDGRMEVLVRSGSVAGTWSRTPEGGWSPFRPFRDTPNVDFADPDVRLADLTGDGRAAEHVNKIETAGLRNGFDASA